eukprot:8562701-Lingulodinium_polyedra.AAC.1
MCFSREHGRSSALPARRTGKSDEGGKLKGEAVKAGGAGACGAGQHGEAHAPLGEGSAGARG